MAGLYHMTVTDTKRSTKYFAVTFPEKESKCTNRYTSHKMAETDCDNGKCQQTVWQEDACKTTHPYCVVIGVCGMDRI